MIDLMDYSALVSHLREQLRQAEDRERQLQDQLQSAEAAQHQLQAYADDFRQTYQESRRRLNRMEALYELTTTLGSNFDPNEVIRLTVGLVGRIIEHAGAMVYLPDEQ